MRFFTLLSALSLVAVQGVAATNNFRGVTIASFNSDGSCKNRDQWLSTVQQAKNLGYKGFRIYGDDCNTFDSAANAARTHGLKVLVGIWVSGTMASAKPSIDTQLASFINAVRSYGLSNFAGLTVGNEVGDAAINIMNRVWDIRGYLQGALGINVPVGTVHTWVNIRDNPVLCDADFVAANAHPFYDPNTPAQNAGSFVQNVVMGALRSACAPYNARNNIQITESGWPSRGAANGQGVPSVANAQTALQGLNCASKANGNNIYAFEYEDSNWKGDDRERSFGVNKYGTGIYNTC